MEVERDQVLMIQVLVTHELVLQVFTLHVLENQELVILILVVQELITIQVFVIHVPIRVLPLCMTHVFVIILPEEDRIHEEVFVPEEETPQL